LALHLSGFRHPTGCRLLLLNGVALRNLLRPYLSHCGVVSILWTASIFYSGKKAQTFIFFVYLMPD
jgi:hypothetical protein